MVKFTESAIKAINTSFDRADIEDRNIELGMNRKDNLINYFFVLLELDYPGELKDSHIIIVPGTVATFKVYLPKQLIKDYEDVIIDYVLVHSEKDQQEGEIFTFTRGILDAGTT